MVHKGRHDLNVRPPAVAGSFYPANPDRLRREVEQHLANVPERADNVPERAGAMPAALIAPHAGYVYSGPVAGHSFTALRAGLRERAPPARVVVIGPAHYV